MRYTEIMLAVFVLVALTFAGLLRSARGAGTRSDPVVSGVAPLDVLFYAAVALAMPLRRADWIMVILAWVYVVVRVFDTGGLWAPSIRNAPVATYGAALVLLAMWVYFALTFLLAI
jgi:hypothetical protein